MTTEYSVKPVNREDCRHFIMDLHYAKRWPSISYSYGLFLNKKIVGVVTYGTPPSAPLRRGIAGDDFKQNVLELNRLCLLRNLRNEGSILVGRSLKMIDGNRIIISFADTEQNHIGYVYQACNFFYCGLSAKRTDWKIQGMEHLHGQTVADKFRGNKSRRKAMEEKYGDMFYLKDRPRKHRYVYFLGTRFFKKEAKKSLKYKIQNYPKEIKHDY